MLQRVCDKCNTLLKTKPYWAIEATGYNHKDCPNKLILLDLCCDCATSLYSMIKPNKQINKEK